MIFTQNVYFTAAGSKRGSLGGASDIGLEEYLVGAPGRGGGRHPSNTDQFYADQYDQYYRYLSSSIPEINPKQINQEDL